MREKEEEKKIGIYTGNPPARVLCKLSRAVEIIHVQLYIKNLYMFNFCSIR